MKNVSGDERNFFEWSDVRHCRVNYNLDGAKINSVERILSITDRTTTASSEF